MSNKSILFLILIIVLSLGMGFFLGNYLKYSRLEINQEEVNYWKKLAENCYPELPEMFTEATGEILEIGDFFIKVKYQDRVSRFPLPGGKEFEEKILKVKLTPDTEIKRLKIIPDPQGNYIAQTEPISLEDIKKGDRVTLNAKENIRGVSEIEAHTVVVYEQIND